MGNNDSMRILILFKTVDALVKSVGSRVMPHGFKFWVCCATLIIFLMSLFDFLVYLFELEDNNSNSLLKRL